ncbi:hypothetical protein TCON_2549 [Astathelohania contejeani]|uniref:Uncharacterized protein n=1 Tax=Astathelohania contejeani TaxID=164912 RepID=A0ABQ7HVP9_9MICR|nr:hypothetical protein TCON_2549 [Thelohania contejeani]
MADKILVIGILYFILGFIALANFAFTIFYSSLQSQTENIDFHKKDIEKLFFYNSCEFNECVMILTSIFSRDLLSFYAGIMFVFFRILDAIVGYLFYDLGLLFTRKILLCKIILLIYFYIMVKSDKKWEEFKKIGASERLLKCYSIRRRLIIFRKLSSIFHFIPLMIGYRYKPKMFSIFSIITFVFTLILQKSENNEIPIQKICSILLWGFDLTIHIHRIHICYYAYKR